MSNIKEIAHFLAPGRALTGRWRRGRFVYEALDGIPIAYLRGQRPFALGVRAVLAGAYRGDVLDRRTALTHAVALDAQGGELRALCRGVAFENLCDRAYGGPPTCPTCARRAAK